MTLKETIEQQVVNDYFTPNIKAEVILDTLLTPYISQIIRTQCGIDAKLLTKEMSMEDVLSENDRGAKIDYVLEDDKNVYLVELKTTTGSIKKKQVIRYLQHCCGPKHEPKTFGDVFGKKLLKLINKYYKKYIPSECWPMVRLKTVFQTIAGDCKADEHADRASKFLKAEGLAGTYKYLYTAGQILDKCSDLDALWKKELRLIYITPNGEQPHEDLITAPCFYLRPQNSKKSVSLTDAVLSLEPGSDDGEYVQILRSIISKIYDKEEITP